MRLPLLLLTTLALYGGPEDREVWLLEQEVLKLGKKEVYEHAKEGWFEDFEQSAKLNTPTIIGIDDLDSSQYFYLIPFQNFTDIDAYRKQLKDFRFTVSSEKWLAQQQTIASTLGARFALIFQYKPECSSEPVSFFQNPKLKLSIFSVAIGQDEAFEQSLIQKAAAVLKSGKKESWRVFKLLYGSDLPKYLICSFGEEEIDLVDSALKEMVVRERSFSGLVRPELSIHPQ